MITVIISNSIARGALVNNASQSANNTVQPEESILSLTIFVLAAVISMSLVTYLMIKRDF